MIFLFIFAATVALSIALGILAILFSIILPIDPATSGGSLFGLMILAFIALGIIDAVDHNIVVDLNDWARGAFATIGGR